MKSNYYYYALLSFVLLAFSTLGGYAQGDDEIYQLNPFSVDEEETGYASTVTISGTGMRTSLMNVPMAINVITSEFLEDSLVNDFVEALDYNSSITQTTRNNLGATRPSSFSIRGFRNRNLLVDGVTGGLYIPAQMVDRIEVVKGPNTLYGQSDPGGLINVITKTPKPEDGGSVSFNIGNQGRVGGKLDYTLHAMDGKLGLRILSEYKDHDGWRWVDGQETKFIGVSGNYKFSDQTEGFFLIADNNQDGFPTQRATWSFERIPTDLNGDGDFSDNVDGVGESNTRYNNTFIPREYVTSTPGNIFESDNNFLSMGLRHSFSEGHNIQYKYNFYDTHQRVSFREFNTFSPISGSDDKISDANNSLNDSRTRDEVHTINDIIDFETGDVRHQLLIGFRRSETVAGGDGTYRLRAVNGTENARLREIEVKTGKMFRDYLYKSDILSGVPIWEDDVPSPSEIREYGQRANNSDRSFQDIDTIYVTDNIFFMEERLNILAGVRHIDINQKSIALGGAPQGTPIDANDTNFQLGGVYRINPNLSFFANVADAFEPQNATDPDTGEFIGPQTSDAIEVGFKFLNLFDEKVSGSVSAFKIKKDNVVRNDFNPVTFMSDQSVTSDESKGIEFELFVNPVSNWSIVAAYSFIDAKVVGEVATGLRLEGATPHRFTLFNSYTVDGGPMEGLRIGGGMVWAEGPIQQFGNIVNRFVQEDGYTTFDFFLRYPSMWGDQPVTYGLNVDNITDEFFVRSRAATNEARQILFTLSFDL